MYETPRSINRPLVDMAALEYILLGDLRDLLEEEPNEQTSKWLVAILDTLIDTLPRELAIKSRNGYLEDVLEAYPNWEAEVQRLHAEYKLLCVRLEAFRDQLVSRTPYASIASQLREDLSEWMKALQNHHRQETRLLQTAVNLEVGGGD
jgi:hypothetical protein